MERKRWAFPLVGVAAVRRGGETTVALAGVAPIPWLLDGIARRGDAAAGERLQGRDRTRARATRARRRRVQHRAARAGSVRSLAARRRLLDGVRRPRDDADAAAARRRARRRAEARTDDEADRELDAAKTYEVDDGDELRRFTITLDQKQSPNATASFVSLVHEAASSTSTIFHRIVPGFVIQGGDPTATGTGGPGYSTVDTPPADAKYTHGVVAMAKTAAEPAGTAGSQFFVVTGDDAGLPPDYAIVGKVTEGLDVVDAIGKLGDADEQPTRGRRDREGDRHRARDRRGRRARGRRGHPLRLAEAARLPARRARAARPRRRSTTIVVVEGAYPLDELDELAACASSTAPTGSSAPARASAAGSRRSATRSTRARRARRRAAARPARGRAVIEHRGDADVVAASYDGTRDHPAVLSRAAWAEIPDEGARALEATLVPCDDLEPPGDIDYPQLWQPPE